MEFISAVTILLTPVMAINATPFQQLQEVQSIAQQKRMR